MESAREKKESLIEKLTMAINEEVLNEMDYLMILQICIDACKRKQTELFEDVLMECILAETDEDAEQE